MLLIDAVYINNGGGKILLDYLISQLEESNIETYFLLDNRIFESHPKIKDDRVEYINGSLLERHLFYSNNNKKFSKVLCFGNIPPSVKIDATVLTYFHQPMYLDIPKEFSLIERFKFKLKIAVLKIVAKNTDYWLVQSDLIKEKMHSKFCFNPESIKILPFYPSFKPLNIEISRNKETYFYVSNASPHKNHIRLIDVFCRFYDKYKKGKLILTVNDSYSEVVEVINEKIKLNYPIENIGFVDRITLQQMYMRSEYLIFPSLSESFGLGLIEAIECGCKVIASDLSYTYEVCEPTLVFDPFDDESIFNALENSLGTYKLKPSLPRIKNNINEIINILK